MTVALRRIAVATTAVALLAACGGSPSATPSVSVSSAAPSAAPSSAITASIAPTPVSTGVDETVLAQLRGILEASVAATKADGLTETWNDYEGIKSLVVVWDPKTQQSVSLDVELNEAEVGDFEYMTPAIALTDLDSIIAGEYEAALVSKDASGHFFVKFDMDGETYTTTYSVDSKGRINTSTTYAGPDLLGIVSLEYSVTSDGQKALDVAAAQQN